VLECLQTEYRHPFHRLSWNIALTRSFRVRNEDDQKSVFLSTPISGLHHQSRMQMRISALSARTSGFVESSRSGRGSDSELSHVWTIQTNDFTRRTCSPYHIPIPQQQDLPISWNIAPTQDVFAIQFNPETQQRSLDTLRWRLIPNWAKDPKIAYKTINARAETVDPASSHRLAFKKRRYLIPVDGFYESKKVLGGKFPHSIGKKDDSPFVADGGELRNLH
jgi:hypothetical protein